MNENTYERQDRKSRVDLFPDEVDSLSFECESMDLTKVDYEAPILQAMQKSCDESMSESDKAEFQRSRFEEIRRLLQEGADPLLSTDTGITPLHQAASEGDGKLCGLLLDHGAKINIFDELWTPLHRAAHNDHYGVCCYLVSRDADVTASQHSRTALYHAVYRRKFETAATLFFLNGLTMKEYYWMARQELGIIWFLGCIMEICGYKIGRPYRRTPLMGAARLGLHGVCRELLRCGADVGLRDDRNLTALDLAKDPDVCRFEHVPDGIIDHEKTIVLLEQFAQPE